LAYRRAVACSIAETRQLPAVAQQWLVPEVARLPLEVEEAEARLSREAAWLSLLQAEAQRPLEEARQLLPQAEAWWPLALYQPPELAQYLPLERLPQKQLAESQSRPLNQRGFARYLPLER
jgi:hypothetical protein